MSDVWYEWRDAPRADFAVLGDPVGHSRSPRMHMAAYRELGMGLRYVGLRVPATEVGAAFDFLEAKGYRGVNITVPLKEEAVIQGRLQVEGIAAVLGVVNTVAFGPVRRAVNTDAPALVETLGQAGFGAGARALVLGAGGTARAAHLALLQAGFKVSAWNRTPGKLQALLAGLEIEEAHQVNLEGISVLLNTTSAGLTGEVLPVLWETANPGLLAYDMVYGKAQNPFLAEASCRGIATMDGLPMLVEQGALAFEWWLGTPAPREAMMKAVL